MRGNEGKGDMGEREEMGREREVLRVKFKTCEAQDTCEISK